MNTTLGEIYADAAFRLGKDQRGGYLTPQTFNLAITTVNWRKMNNCIDLFEKNQEVTSDLQPFIKTLGSPQYAPLTFTPVLSSSPSKGGYCEIPEDFWYEARANYNKTLNGTCDADVQYRPVEFVPQHIFDAIMSTSLLNPTMNEEAFPVMVISNNLFYVYPFIKRVSFTYLRQPATPVFDYDIVSGVPVYLPPGEVHINSSVLPAGTPSQSVEFEWPESCVDELTDMVKTYVAVGNEAKFSLETQLPSKNK